MADSPHEPGEAPPREPAALPPVDGAGGARTANMLVHNDQIDAGGAAPAPARGRARTAQDYLQEDTSSDGFTVQDDTDLAQFSDWNVRGPHMPPAATRHAGPAWHCVVW